MIIEQEDFDHLIEISEKLSPTPVGPDNYWRTLLKTSFTNPHLLNTSQIFELGRFSERMFQLACNEDNAFDSMLVLRCTRTVQGRIDYIMFNGDRREN